MRLLLFFLPLFLCAKLSIDPQLVQSSGDIVTFTWSNIQTPNSTDHIALFILHDELMTLIGRIYLTESPTWQYGYGSIQKPMINLRHDFLVELITNSDLAVNQLVTFKNWNEPLQTHLALTEDRTEMRVMWVTADDVQSFVRYGWNRQLGSVVQANSSSYTASEMCASPANETEYFLDPGVIHDAVMSGLAPGQKYFYQVGNDQDGWSQVYEFFAAPGYDVPVDGVLFGDMGTGVAFSAVSETQQMALKTTAHLKSFIERSKTPFVFHVGDISYARGNAWKWEYFFDMVQSISTRAPYMVLIGNHEFDYEDQSFKPEWSNYGSDSSGECGIPYFSRFHMPKNSDSPRSGLWYSFDFGPIHFTVMSTEHNFLEGSPQYEWIRQDLASIDRSKTPWSVFTGHRPFYTSTDQGFGANMAAHLRESLEPLLIQYNVDACFYGHVHHYERFCHLNNGNCVPEGEGPVHVVVGNAGNSYQVPYIQQPNSHHYDQPDWVIFRTANFGYGRFFANQTHFTWQFAGDISNEIHDHFTLKK